LAILELSFDPVKENLDVGKMPQGLMLRNIVIQAGKKLSPRFSSEQIGFALGQVSIRRSG
jgi:hypothetical protein